MESNMVSRENLPLQSTDSILLIESFFKKNFPQFDLKDKGHYTAYWWLEYSKEPVKIYFNGDERSGFSIDISIDGTKYSLWQYDKGVNKAGDATEKNILYQLEVLKRFLDESQN